MMLPYIRITRGPCEVIILFPHGVSTLMWFCVAHMSAIPYVGLLFGGLPLHLLQILLICLIYSSTLVKYLLINLSLLLSILLVPNLQPPSGMPLVLPNILFKDVDLSLWQSSFLRH